MTPHDDPRRDLDSDRDTARMEWDDELEFDAEEHAAKCEEQP